MDNRYYLDPTRSEQLAEALREIWKEVMKDCPSRISIAKIYHRIELDLRIPCIPEHKYYIKHYRWYSGRGDTDCVLIGMADTLEEAKEKREVSGDLVVDRDGYIVPDKAWLWDYERDDVNSYAHKAIIKFGEEA